TAADIGSTGRPPHLMRLARSSWLTTSTKRRPSFSSLTTTTSPRPISTPLTRTSSGAPGPRSSSTTEPRPSRMTSRIGNSVRPSSTDSFSGMSSTRSSLPGSAARSSPFAAPPCSARFSNGESCGARFPPLSNCCTASSAMGSAPCVQFLLLRLLVRRDRSVDTYGALGAEPAPATAEQRDAFRLDHHALRPLDLENVARAEFKQGMHRHLDLRQFDAQRHHDLFDAGLDLLEPVAVGLGVFGGDRRRQPLPNRTQPLRRDGDDHRAFAVIDLDLERGDDDLLAGPGETRILRVEFVTQDFRLKLGDALPRAGELLEYDRHHSRHHFLFDGGEVALRLGHGKPAVAAEPAFDRGDDERCVDGHQHSAAQRP